jgi:hypothetical protein
MWTAAGEFFKFIFKYLLPILAIIVVVWLGFNLVKALFGVDFGPAFQKFAARSGAAIASVIPEPRTSRDWNEEAHRAEVRANEARREAETAKIYANAHAAAEAATRARDRGERSSNDLIKVHVKTRSGTYLPATVFFKTSADPVEQSTVITASQVGSIEAVPGITYQIWARLEDGSNRYCETQSLLYEGGEKKVVLYF